MPYSEQSCPPPGIPTSETDPAAHPSTEGWATEFRTSAEEYPSKPDLRQHRRRLALVASTMLLACLLTWYFHVVLRSGAVFSHLFYIPIILSALWWQRRGMLTALFLSGALLSSSGLLHMEMTGINDCLRALMFLAVSWLVARQSERISANEAAVKRQARDLEQRVCELSCLYGIEALRDDNGVPLNATLQAIADLMPKFLRHRPLAGVQIVMGRGRFRSSPFSETGRHLNEPILVGGKTIGRMSLFHVASPLPTEEAHAAAADVRLVKAVAGRIGRILEHESAKKALKLHRENLEALVRRRTRDVLRAHDKLKAETSERRLAEKALAESEEKYRHLVENAGEAIVLIQEGRIRFANRRTVELLAHPADRLVETTPCEWVHPEDRPVLRVHHRQGESSPGAQPSTVTFRVLPDPTRTVWVEATLAGTRLNDRPAAIAFIRDVSVQRMLEQRMHQVHKMQAIGTLAGGIAHRFNNALAGLSGSLDLLLCKRPEDPAVRQHGDIAGASVSLMTQLTAQLLAYARGGKYQPATTDLNVCVEECLLSIRPVLGNAVAISTDLDPISCPVLADATQIQTVLLAVLQNAAEAMGENGRILIRTRRRAVDKAESELMPGFRPGTFAVVDIDDNGAGMDAKTVERIFEPFFSTKDPGRGLAMAAAYGIVKNHGGWIGVNSSPRLGTVVCIYLPLVTNGKDGNRQ